MQLQNSEIEVYYDKVETFVSIGDQSTKRDLIQAWNHYLSGLILSEAGAARECFLLSDEFADLGYAELAKEYRKFAFEELDHSNLAKAMSPVDHGISKRAELVFSGKMLEGGQKLLKKLIVIHSIFEPSGLAIMGYLNQHSDLIFEPKRSEIIKACTSSILKEEIAHVWDGAKTIKTLMRDKVIEPPTAETIKSVKFHIQFIKVGFKSFFKNCDGYEEEINKILNKMDFYMKQSMDIYGIKI